MVVKGEDAQTAFDNINWKAVAFERAKAFAFSFVSPTGLQTAGRIARISKTPVGKFACALLANVTSEVSKKLVAGDFNDDDGNFSYSELEGEYMNIAFSVMITTMLDKAWVEKLKSCTLNLKNQTPSWQASIRTCSGTWTVREVRIERLIIA